MLKLGVNSKLREIKKVKEEIELTMDEIKRLKSTENMIKKLEVFNKQLDTATHAKENKKQLTYQIMVLNEQMKLLVDYQKKERNYHHLRSIFEHK